MSVLLVLALFAAFGAAGCGDSESSGGASSSGDTTAAADPKTSTIGLMVFDLKSAFAATQADTMRAMVEKVGGKLVVMDPSNDPAKQLRMAQDWLNQGKVDALVGSTVDITTFQPALDLAAEKGVPVVTLGFEPKKLQRGETVVTQDFKDWGVQIGTAIAKCVDERLGGKSEAVILDDVHRAGPIIPSLNSGFEEGFATNPGIELAAKPDAPDRLKSLQAMQDVLTAHPDVNAAVGSDDQVLGAMQALKAKGKDPKTDLCLVGTGGTPEGTEAMKSGDFYAVGDAQLSVIYDIALNAAWAQITNPDDPKYSAKIITTPYVMRYHQDAQ
ncbi:MAG: sugar ABC transporter substrate-binding protein [Conexibacter sp.]